MNTSYLREFIVLADVKNFQEAAATLFVSQSSLSKHINAIEKDLNVPLFDRTTRSVRLNHYGEAFLVYAKQIVALEQQCKDTFKSFSHEYRQTVLIGAFRAMQQYDLPNLFADFSRACPNIYLNINETDPWQIKEHLRNGHFELAFIQEPELSGTDKDSDLEKLIFFEDVLVAVINKKNPLSIETMITPEMLAGQRILTYPENTYSREMCDSFFARAGITPRITFSGHRFSTIVQMAANGAGIGIILREQALYDRNSEIVTIPLEPSFRMNLALCYVKSAELSFGASAFVKWFREQYDLM